MLWIAFKKLYLWYSEQQDARLKWKRLCCELLSKNCIFDILNNPPVKTSSTAVVVNCFQKIVSLIFWTTRSTVNRQNMRLWIAFKKLYLWYSEQPVRASKHKKIGCELLSKNCIFDILNNKILIYQKIQKVVNCFQKIVSLIFWTTMNEIRCLKCSLWIAFKKLYLWYSEQPISPLGLTKWVVNCFQKIVSLIFWTTIWLWTIH